MPSNQFLAWALGTGANIETQSAYAADTARTNGVVAGTATSALYNKAQRQSAFMAVVIATLIYDQLEIDVLDDGDIAGMVTDLQNAILQVVSTEGFATVTALSGEAGIRAAADTALGDGLSSEISRAEGVEGTLSTAIGNEVTRAENAEAAIALRTVPSGSMTMYAGATAPAQWLECDGSAVSRTTYAVLFSAISTTYGIGNGTTTFNLPDMRGYWARGWDHGAGVDSGRALGSVQADAIMAHKHVSPIDASGGNNRPYGQTATTFSMGGINATTTQSYPFTNNGTPISGAIGDNPNPIGTVLPENRVKNVALMFIIKI